VRLYLLARSPGSSLWEFRLQYLDEAIRIDPLFARAYAERAYRSVNDLDNIDVASLPAREERIKSDIETALELDPTLGYAFVAQARLDMHHGRFDDARSAFENALALAPNDTEILDRYGGFLRRAEDFAEAVQVTQRAVALDPENSELHDALGDVLLFSGSLDATAAAYRRAIELGDPTVGARIRLGLVEMARGDEAEALSYLRVGEYMMEAPGELFSPALSYGYARLDRAADADRVREQFFQRVADGDVDAPSSSALALFSLAQDDVGTTLAHIRNAVENEIEPLEFAGYIIKYNLIADPILERREFVEQRSFLELR
jgi:tetratricopeptide (TPR) repeat protein